VCGKRIRAPGKKMIDLLRLKDQDINKAYDIICWRFNYLQSKGIEQYIQPYPPFDVYKVRQIKGQNFGLYINGNLSALVTLVHSFPEEWSEIKPDNKYLWISSLFSSKEIRGQNISKILMDKVEDYAKSLSIDTLILDCYINETEFLVKYYQKLGFTEKLRKEIMYPNHRFPAALMFKNIED
jgi:GNAT superfamily N-acetyltransferase